MGQEPDPSGARAELISDRSSKYVPRCDVTNLETLRHKVIVYTVCNIVILTDKTYGGEHVHSFHKHAPCFYSRLAFEEVHQKLGKELDITLPDQMRNLDDFNMPLLHHIYMQEEGSKKLYIPVQLNTLIE
ncbi:hypothetical protein PF010_g1427 [Phytophthora fragariae]|uniref:Stealth protein CR3 conserved region 3 domain-containing protein n=1 Tax=Phytophthora fragariae TaxID=53985 RepID=A0A6A3MGR5_9STRA|nr:hypothetical protein PF003_g27086 [Phytophthora fragariae]KAE9029128.1 hypothetical protein PF011_g1212 [Phytophthora fragariae]KAE9137149.1 hypothetical protein PF010_g1427 [Phytophthora fragariae]KAE9154552.1 hypothetical protein PF006_g1418 [Phytophthora fragariae]KAE9255697.1 hypothetical protein PF002_g2224 [Phytophthora fragariae]